MNYSRNATQIKKSSNEKKKELTQPPQNILNISSDFNNGPKKTHTHHIIFATLVVIRSLPHLKRARDCSLPNK